MAKITGKTSTFPATLDDWGEEKKNGTPTTCEEITAAYWNHITDAIYNMEKNSRLTLRTGEKVIYETGFDTTQPVILFKSYTFVLTGATSHSRSVSIAGPLFTTNEKNLFAGGNPLDQSLVSIIMSARLDPTTTTVPRVGGQGGANKTGDVIVSLDTKDLVDLTGDSGINIVLSHARHVAPTKWEFNPETDALNVSNGTYLLNMMLVNN